MREHSFRPSSNTIASSGSQSSRIGKCRTSLRSECGSSPPLLEIGIVHPGGDGCQVLVVNGVEVVVEVGVVLLLLLRVGLEIVEKFDICSN